MFQLPLTIALAHLRRWDLDVEEPDPAGGPFSLSDPALVADRFGRAGWADITFRTHDLSLPIGGGLPPVEAALASMQLGPTRLVTESLDDDRREAVQAAIADEYGDHLDDDGHVRLGATVVIISARKPA